MLSTKMPGDALYWNPTDSEESLDYPSKEPYVDPWDLENYAYIREHLDSMELSSTPSAPSGSSGEFAEANSNSFYYVPGNRHVGPPYIPTIQEKRNYDSVLSSEQENYAAIDEVKMYDRRTRSEIFAAARRGRHLEEYESELEESPYDDGIIVQENPVFGVYDEQGRFRKVAIPITYSRTPRDRSLSFAYGDYDYDPYSLRTDIYSKLEDLPDNKDSPLPIYDDLRRAKRKPDNFGLSKYGHLKIDYSYSWNNLNKYIKYN